MRLRGLRRSREHDAVLRRRQRREGERARRSIEDEQVREGGSARGGGGADDAAGVDGTAPELECPARLRRRVLERRGSGIGVVEGERGEGVRVGGLGAEKASPGGPRRPDEGVADGAGIDDLEGVGWDDDVARLAGDPGGASGREPADVVSGGVCCNDRDTLTRGEGDEGEARVDGVGAARLDGDLVRGGRVGAGEAEDGPLATADQRGSVRVTAFNVAETWFSYWVVERVPVAAVQVTGAVQKGPEGRLSSCVQVLPTRPMKWPAVYWMAPARGDARTSAPTWREFRRVAPWASSVSWVVAAGANAIV